MGNATPNKVIISLPEAEAALGSEFEILKNYYSDKVFSILK